MSYKITYEKSKNSNTGIVHALNGKKVGPLEMKQTLCGVLTGLVWTASNEESITCMKCRSKLLYKNNL